MRENCFNIISKAKVSKTPTDWEVNGGITNFFDASDCNMESKVMEAAVEPAVIQMTCCIYFSYVVHQVLKGSQVWTACQVTVTATFWAHLVLCGLKGASPKAALSSNSAECRKHELASTLNVSSTTYFPRTHLFQRKG